MGRFVRTIAPAAASNALALMVLKVCTPGVPDFFQGTELFEATLTDPDNRRPVDFTVRKALLASLPAPGTPEADLVPQVQRMLDDWENGQIKLHVIRALLQLRRAFPDLFAERFLCSPCDVRAERGEPGGMVAAPRAPLGRRRGPPLGTRGRRSKAIPDRIPDLGEHDLCAPPGCPAVLRRHLHGPAYHDPRGRIEVANVLRVLPVAVLRVADEG